MVASSTNVMKVVFDVFVRLLIVLGAKCILKQREEERFIIVDENNEVHVHENTVVKFDFVHHWIHCEDFLGEAKDGMNVSEAQSYGICLDCYTEQSW